MFRADAFASVNLLLPLRRRQTPKRGRIPILMYHSISASATETAHPYYRTVTTPDVFASHVKYLHENGFSVVPLTEAVKSMNARGETSERLVAITFDDGYRDFYSEAFPILNAHGFKATVYLPSAYIGDSTQTFKGIECLTWKETRELHAAGIEFGSHTVTHPQLQSMRPESVEYEVQASKDTIEQHLGSAVTSFAYPYAFPEGDRPFTIKLRGMLEAAGYENGVCTIIGTADHASDTFFLERLPMNSCDDAPLFEAKLAGAYDWLHGVQYASKLIKSRR